MDELLKSVYFFSSSTCHDRSMVMMCTDDNMGKPDNIDVVHNKRPRMRTDLFEITLNQMEVATLCVRTAFAICSSNDNNRLYKTAA